MENSKTSLSELISLERPNWQHQPKNALSAANAVTTLKQVHEIVNGPARLLSLDLEFYCDGQPQMPREPRGWARLPAVSMVRMMHSIIMCSAAK